jgi:hypothetical protein
VTVKGRGEMLEKAKEEENSKLNYARKSWKQ